MMQQQFGTESFDSDDDDMFPKLKQKGSPRRNHMNYQMAMAKEQAIMRLIRHSKNKLASAMHQHLIEPEKKAPPVQVDPYMLKELLEGLQEAEKDSNAPTIQQR